MTMNQQYIGSASKTLFAKLDIIQLSALRLITGAYKSSPVSSLHIETNILPLQYWRDLNMKWYSQSFAVLFRDVFIDPMNFWYSNEVFRYILSVFIYMYLYAFYQLGIPFQPVYCIYKIWQPKNY